MEITEEEKFGTITGSEIAILVKLSLRNPQVNPFVYEIHKSYKGKQQKVQKATQTDPKPKKQ